MQINSIQEIKDLIAKYSKELDESVENLKPLEDIQKFLGEKDKQSNQEKLNNLKTKILQIQTMVLYLNNIFSLSIKATFKNMTAEEFQEFKNEQKNKCLLKKQELLAIQDSLLTSPDNDEFKKITQIKELLNAEPKHEYVDNEKEKLVSIYNSLKPQDIDKIIDLTNIERDRAKTEINKKARHLSSDELYHEIEEYDAMIKLFKEFKNIYKILETNEIEDKQSFAKNRLLEYYNNSLEVWYKFPYIYQRVEKIQYKMLLIKLEQEIDSLSVSKGDIETEKQVEYIKNIYGYLNSWEYTVTLQLTKGGNKIDIFSEDYNKFFQELIKSPMLSLTIPGYKEYLLEVKKNEDELVFVEKEIDFFEEAKQEDIEQKFYNEDIAVEASSIEEITRNVINIKPDIDVQSGEKERQYAEASHHIQKAANLKIAIETLELKITEINKVIEQESPVNNENEVFLENTINKICEKRTQEEEQEKIIKEKYNEASLIREKRDKKRIFKANSQKELDLKEKEIQIEQEKLEKIKQELALLYADQKRGEDIKKAFVEKIKKIAIGVNKNYGLQYNINHCYSLEQIMELHNDMKKHRFDLLNEEEEYILNIEKVVDTARSFKELESKPIEVIESVVRLTNQQTDELLSASNFANAGLSKEEFNSTIEETKKR